MTVNPEEISRFFSVRFSNPSCRLGSLLMDKNPLYRWLMLTKSPLLMAKTAKFPFFCCSFCQRRWNPHLCGWKKSTVLCRFNHGFLLKSPWRRLTSTFLKNPHLNWCLSKSPKNRSTYFFNWLWWRDELPLNPRGLLLEKKDTSLRNFTRTKTLQNTSPALAQASDGQLFQAHVHTQYLRGPVKWLFQAWALFWTKI